MPYSQLKQEHKQLHFSTFWNSDLSWQVVDLDKFFRFTSHAPSGIGYCDKKERSTYAGMNLMYYTRMSLTLYCKDKSNNIVIHILY